MKRVLCCWVVCIVLTFSAQAQLAPQAELLLHVENDRPTYELILRLDADRLYWLQDESECAAELEILVDLKGADGSTRHHARLLQRIYLPEERCANGPDTMLIVRQSVRWQPGLHAAEISVRDRNANALFWESIDLQAHDDDQAFYMSDLFLCDSLGGSFAQSPPLIDYRLAAERQRLPYIFSLYTGRPRSLRMSVQLFLRGEVSPGAPSTPYQSVYSEIEPLYLNPGTTELQRILPLEALPSGEYLAEVYLFEDEEIIAERSAAFERVWPGLKQVYRRLPKAVDQLSPRLTKSQLLAMQAGLKTRGQSAFESYWERLARRYGDQPRRLVEQYYQEIEDARASLKVAQPWTTDPGRIWLQYGPPDETLTDTLNGRVFTRWQYDRHQLSFLFSGEGGSARLLN